MTDLPDMEEPPHPGVGRAESMVERVAKAMWVADCKGHPDAAAYWTTQNLGRQAYRRRARAAIAAMREPTEAMLQAAVGADGCCQTDANRTDLARVWRAMIDQALAEVTGGGDG